MITFFNSHSIWTGTDMQKFSQIRDILEVNSIPYKYKTKNHLSELNGRGTHRSTMGSFGNSASQMYQYEILVYKKDAEKVGYLLNKR
jgi:hypothetical protein